MRRMTGAALALCLLVAAAFAAMPIAAVPIAAVPIARAQAETAEQVEMRMKMNEEMERLEAERDLPYYLWTIDQKYGYEQQFIDYLTNVERQRWFAALPGEGDLTEADATALARAAIVEAFGEDALDDTCEVSAIYMTDSETGITEWDFAFYMGPRDARTAVYHASIDEATDEVFGVSDGEVGQG